MVDRLTNQQLAIINDTENLVVIAKPGSGKTTTIAYKASKILKELNDYKGIIAISFTKKASNELKEKINKICDNSRSSFFGTIDSFCLNEIIFPFAKHIFNSLPSAEIDVLLLENIAEYDGLIFKKSLENGFLEDSTLELIKKYYNDGKIIMELNGIFSNYILDKSVACKKYFLSKYTHIFIDEYQDCDYFQNEIFKKLVDINLIGNAVGDPEQSIFSFAGKQSKFLTDLVADSKFNTLPLDINHRSHQSIVEYSLKFLDFKKNIDKDIERRVSRLYINGNEKNIAKEIDQIYIEKYKELLKLQKNSKIAILTTNNRTAELIKNEFTSHKVKYIMTTPLDESISIVDNVFSEILKYILDKDYMFYDFKSSLIQYEANFNLSNNISLNLEKVRKKYLQDQNINIDDIVIITEMIIKSSISVEQLINLQKVLNNPDFIKSFAPIDENEIILITIYKAKGMEFDIVFHLDLSEYILPKKIKKNNVFEYADIKQCVHLHYVAITRAKEFCILVVSSERTNWEGRILKSTPSEFVLRKDLDEYLSN